MEKEFTLLVSGHILGMGEGLIQFDRLDMDNEMWKLALVGMRTANGKFKSWWQGETRDFCLEITPQTKVVTLKYGS